MKLLIKKLALVLLMSTFASVAQAAPIVGATGDITGLEVNGDVYNVDWNFGSSNPTAPDFALFSGNAAFTNQFMAAVMTAFTNSSFSGAVGQTYYGVDYGFHDGVFLVDSGSMFFSAGGWHGVWGEFSDAGWGSVTAAAVPDGSSLVLLSLGLLSLGALRRRAS